MQKTSSLDLSAFTKAITQLEQSLAYYHSDIVQRDVGLTLQLQAAAIQAFEFTYELACKMIKRYLDLVEPNPEAAHALSFADLIRKANEYDLLLHDLPVWKLYRKQRGTTSHTYDHEKAEEIFRFIPDFLQEVKFLLQRLQKHSKHL